MKREEKSMRTNIVKITNLNQNPHHTIQTFFFMNGCPPKLILMLEPTLWSHQALIDV